MDISTRNGLDSLSSWREASDHLLRIRNIRGLRRRTAALARLAWAAPSFGLKGLLELRLPSATFPIEAFSDTDLAFRRRRDRLGNNIYVSSTRPVSDRDPIVDAFVRFSAKFDLSSTSWPFHTRRYSALLRSGRKAPLYKILGKYYKCNK